MRARLNEGLVRRLKRSLKKKIQLWGEIVLALQDQGFEKYQSVRSRAC